MPSTSELPLDRIFNNVLLLGNSAEHLLQQMNEKNDLLQQELEAPTANGQEALEMMVRKLQETEDELAMRDQQLAQAYEEAATSHLTREEV